MSDYKEADTLKPIVLECLFRIEITSSSTRDVQSLKAISNQ